LLRGIPRTATVVADQPLRTLALDRETFLVAVTGNSMANAAADALVTLRLTADSLADPINTAPHSWRRSRCGLRRRPEPRPGPPLPSSQ
jgi:hypothetical protein